MQYKAMKLKTIIVIATALLTLNACSSSKYENEEDTPTKKEMAEEMAASHLKGVLYHFDSYEPLQTTVDSSFVSLSTDQEAIELTLDMLKLFQSIPEYEQQLEFAETSMDIYDIPGFSTAYSRREYQRAKEERDEKQRILDKAKERIINQFSKIKDRQSYLETNASSKMGDFDGWKVYHKFKSLNGAGTFDVPGEYIFFCDEDFKEKSAYPKEDYDAIEKIMTAIASSNDVSEMLEKIQDEIY